MDPASRHAPGGPTSSCTKQRCPLGPEDAAEPGRERFVSDYRFWGVDTRVYFTRVEDQEHYDYYFQDHRPVSAPASPAYEVRVESVSGRDVGQARVLVREQGEGWSEPNVDNGTPLPPFRLPPLSSKVRTVHASAAYTAGGAGPSGSLVLHGPSTAGKSILLLALLREGWEFVTDDTLVVQGDHLVLRYCRPVGVRSRALDRLPWLRGYLGKARKFTTPTGITHAVHPFDLGVKIAPEETPWVWTVLLHKSDTFAIHDSGGRTLRLALDVDKHLGKAVDALLEWTSQCSKYFPEPGAGSR